jgi:hypothetical protein
MLNQSWQTKTSIENAVQSKANDEASKNPLKQVQCEIKVLALHFVSQGFARIRDVSGGTPSQQSSSTFVC